MSFQKNGYDFWAYFVVSFENATYFNKIVFWPETYYPAMFQVQIPSTTNSDWLTISKVDSDGRQQYQLLQSCSFARNDLSWGCPYEIYLDRNIAQKIRLVIYAILDTNSNYYRNLWLFNIEVYDEDLSNVITNSQVSFNYSFINNVIRISYYIDFNDTEVLDPIHKKIARLFYKK